MEFKVKIYRYNPEKENSGAQVEYTAQFKPGMSVLDLLHQIHDEQDATLAYRYSCRGAICGTCAIKINGQARLACKTQVNDMLKESDAVTLEPLTHFDVIKDLVVDQRTMWQEIENTMPWLVRDKELADERMTYETHLDKIHLDQLNRSADCIKCGCCYADCPKVDDSPEFIGPAVSIQIYKQVFDPRDTQLDSRKEMSSRENGVFDCDKHANCVKVCPKDCRPLRAITFIQNKVNQ